MARSIIATDGGTHGTPDEVNIYVCADGTCDVDFVHANSVVGGKSGLTLARANEIAQRETAGRLRWVDKYGSARRSAEAEGQARYDADCAASDDRSAAYAAAATVIGRGSAGMVQIGQDLAHVHNDRGAAVVERIDGQWVARAPREGERFFV